MWRKSPRLLVTRGAPKPSAAAAIHASCELRARPDAPASARSFAQECKVPHQHKQRQKVCSVANFRVAHDPAAIRTTTRLAVPGGAICQLNEDAARVVQAARYTRCFTITRPCGLGLAPVTCPEI